jgi:hypothetical protein
MKVTKKPARRKIVVALLGMCVAVSSYAISPAKASTTEAQAAPAVQRAASDHQSRNCAFWYGYYGYYGYYCYYYYYYPYFFFYYY